MVLACCRGESDIECQSVETWAQKEKEKTGVEDLRPLVIGMCPRGSHRDFQCTATTDGPRTLTSAFSKFGSKSKTSPRPILFARAIVTPCDAALAVAQTK